MTTPVGMPYGTAATAGTTQASAPAKSSQMDKDMFLKLLVAQMKYQDPNKPADTSAFLTQTAQFTQVERLDELAKAQTSLLNAQELQRAAGLVGKTVAYTGADGMEAVGVVTSASLTAGAPALRIGDTDVQLSSVKEVRGTATG